MAPEWINWPIWNWISVPLGLGLGFWMGWDNHKHHARMRALLDWKTAPSVALAERLATFKDPRDCPSIDDEIEAFAWVVNEAKRIHGDLREPDGVEADEGGEAHGG